MNFPLNRRDLEEFIGKKSVVEYRIKHEKFIGVAQSVIIEAGSEIPAFIVDYEWVVRARSKPRILGATDIVSDGTFEKRSVRFALPRLVSNKDGILLMKCMGDIVVTMTANTEELLNTMRLKEQ